MGTSNQLNNITMNLFDMFIYLRIKSYKSIDGFLSKNEAISLYKKAASLGFNSKIVEIGSWKGKSTYCLAKGLKSGQVIAIDPFDASGDEGSGSADTYKNLKGVSSLLSQFEENMRVRGVRDKIEIYKGFSQDFAGDISNIDLLFIDGDHSIEGCKNDYLNYIPHLKKGGYIAFHDYYEDREDLGPTWVIKNLVNLNKNISFVELSDSLWIGRLSTN